MTHKLKSQTGPITGPAVQAKQLSAALVLLAEILRHATAYLCESATHNFAKVPLMVKGLAKTSENGHWRERGVLVIVLT